MNRDRFDPDTERRDAPAAEPSPGEIAEGIMHKFVTAMVIAAALIALAIYARPSPPRYQAVIGDGKEVRIDTVSGTMIACEVGRRCYTLLRHGQSLESGPGPVAPPAAPQPLPAPAARPAATPAPAPAGAPATR